MYGKEASRETVHGKIQEAARKPNKSWVYDEENPGKIKVFDGRTGEAFDRPVTVGQSIHAQAGSLGGR